MSTALHHPARQARLAGTYRALGWLGRRLLTGIGVLWAAATFTFLVQSLLPGDRAQLIINLAAGNIVNATPAELDAVDDPCFIPGIRRASPARPAGARLGEARIHQGHAAPEAVRARHTRRPSPGGALSRRLYAPAGGRVTRDTKAVSLGPNGSRMSVMNQHVSDLTPVDIESGDFKSVMRHVAGAVSIITAQYDGARAGLTATSLTALSAEPPTVVICVNRAASAWPTIERAGHFAVNLLGAHQRSIADRFTGRGGHRGEARFGEGHWTRFVTGAPVLSDALASLDCSIDEVIERHSHVLLIGRVKAIRISAGAEALLYWRGLYGSLDETLLNGAGI